MNRRKFLVSAGATTVAAGCAHLRKPLGKLNVACIGIAGKGRSDAINMKSENVVAVCDVDFSSKRTDAVLKAFPEAKKYTDYREMLTDMECKIDAVTVSTPDHTHYPAAMMAISMGKHVFCQKPLTRTMWEARKLTEAAQKYGVATQMGNQGHAGEGPRLVNEWIHAGAIGDVHEVHLWTNRPGTGWGVSAGDDRPEDRHPVPDGLEWNLWLGTAPYRTYHPLYCPGKWRSWWDFGTGALGDMGCHIFDAAFWALDLGYPEYVTAETSPVNDETIPKWSVITYQFPKRRGRPPVKLVWYDGGKMPPRPKDLEQGRDGALNRGGGQYFLGEKGTIMAGTSCTSPRIVPESKMREVMRKGVRKRIPRSPGHVEEWIAACKGGTPAGSNFNYAGPLTELVLLGNLAVRSGQKIKMDPETLRVTNVPSANMYIRNGYRNF